MRTTISRAAPAVLLKTVRRIAQTALTTIDRTPGRMDLEIDPTQDPTTVPTQDLTTDPTFHVQELRIGLTTIDRTT